MPNPTKVIGKCNAKLKARPPDHKGGFCGNKPAIPDRLGGNGRCKYHGGFNAGGIATNAALKRAGYLHPGTVQPNRQLSAYGKFLRDVTNPKFKEIWNEPATTDLSNEITLWQSKIAEFADMLSNPMLAGLKGFDEEKVEELLERATKTVRGLARAQHAMHPEQDQQANFSVTLKLDEASFAKIDSLDVPELEVDGAPVAEPVVIAHEDPITEATRHFLELEAE